MPERRKNLSNIANKKGFDELTRGFCRRIDVEVYRKSGAVVEGLIPGPPVWSSHVIYCLVFRIELEAKLVWVRAKKGFLLYLEGDAVPRPCPSLTL